MSNTVGQVVQVAQSEVDELVEPSNSPATRTFSIARGTAGTFTVITLQEQVTLEHLAALLRQAQEKPFEHSFEKICRLRAAKTAGNKEAASELDRLKHTPWFVCAQLAFYSGARGVLRVLAYLMEHGQYEELHATIRREAREIESIRGRRRSARRH